MRKRRILWLGEASFLSTGYAVYTKEVLKRLYATGLYDIAELGSHGHWNDPKRFDIPWRYYGNAPDITEDNDVYNSNILNQFGQWKFEEICLDWKPDIVASCRDVYMDDFVERSPFRRLFKWAMLTTVDAIPQPEQWLATFMDADAVFNYCEFGYDYLKETLKDKANLCGLAPPAADLELFRPMNKKEIRKSFSLDNDMFIIGTVMRNMTRKLYPDLIESFAKFVEQNPTLGKKTYLYIHCSYPDSGWDIPKLVREANISHRVLFTYVCSYCKHVFPSFFQDSLQPCIKCSHITAGLPNQRVSASTADLGRIMNTFDVYIQYANKEGLGMPQLEAAQCGIPIMSVNYSGMASVIKNVCGIPIKVQRMCREPESHSYIALPDNNHLIEQLVKFFNQPETIRLRMGRKSYTQCIKHYNYDKTAQKWGEYFQSVPIQDNWNIAPILHNPVLNIPNELTNEQFARWIIGNVWGRKNKVDSYTALRMMQDLNYGKSITQCGDSYYNENSIPGIKQFFQDFSRKDAVQHMVGLNKRDVYWEKRRVGLIHEKPLISIVNCKKGINE